MKHLLSPSLFSFLSLHRWDDVQVVEEYYSLPTIVQTRFATHLGGGRAGPSLYSIGGKKSGDPKYANLANIHNAKAPDADDFQEHYVVRARSTRTTHD